MIARSFLLGLGVALGVIGTYYFHDSAVQIDKLKMAQEKQEAIEYATHQANIDKEALQNRYNNLKAENLIAQGRLKQYETEVAKLQSDLLKAKQALAFYQDMMPEESNPQSSPTKSLHPK